MMRISDPNLIYYACIAKATTVLAEFNSKDADLGSLAIRCLERTPPLHSVFSHTVRNRTYAFLIDEPFSYFVIFDEKLDNSEGLGFLKSVKEAFNGLKTSANKRLEALTSHCLQGEFNPVFHQLLSPNPVIGGLDSPSLGISFTSDESSDLSRGSGSGPVGMPLLADPVATLKKKRRSLFGECSGGEARKGGDLMSDRGLDPSVDGTVGLSREFSLIMNKNVLYSGEFGHSQKAAKKVWKKHVWVVLSMDLIICTILFVVWLCICGGFKCIDN